VQLQGGGQAAPVLVQVQLPQPLIAGNWSPIE
jgi:hypothetical protein